MFAGWMRRRQRARLTPLINAELDAAEAARLRADIAADPHLQAELRRLHQVVDLLHRLPAVPVPPSLRTALAVELDLLEEPLRAKYTDILDGAAADAAAAVAARPALQAELDRLRTVVTAAHAVPDVAVPERLGEGLRRRLADLEPPARALPHRAPRWAVAGAALAAFGWLIARQMLPGPAVPSPSRGPAVALLPPAAVAPPLAPTPRPQTALPRLAARPAPAPQHATAAPRPMAVAHRPSANRPEHVLVARGPAPRMLREERREIGLRLANAVRPAAAGSHSAPAFAFADLPRRAKREPAAEPVSFNERFPMDVAVASAGPRPTMVAPLSRQIPEPTVLNLDETPVRLSFASLPTGGTATP